VLTPLNPYPRCACGFPLNFGFKPNFGLKRSVQLSSVEFSKNRRKSYNGESFVVLSREYAVTYNQ